LTHGHLVTSITPPAFSPALLDGKSSVKLDHPPGVFRANLSTQVIAGSGLETREKNISLALSGFRSARGITSIEPCKRRQGRSGGRDWFFVAAFFAPFSMRSCPHVAQLVSPIRQSENANEG
jgi:hypothetical protein